jgi:hypothetical protein
MDDRRFLQPDTGYGLPDRILIFKTRENIEIRTGSTFWLSDGTFAAHRANFNNFIQFTATILVKEFASYMLWWNQNTGLILRVV